ncbi:hypothetical protein KKF86_09850 [bacterium]|nr:hypothetical protein [bacterium]
MQLFITITIVLTAGLLVLAGILLLFSPEVLIRVNDYLIGLSKKKVTMNKGKLLSIDVYIFTKRILFGLALILLGIYLIYTISLLF